MTRKPDPSSRRRGLNDLWDEVTRILTNEVECSINVLIRDQLPFGICILVILRRFFDIEVSDVEAVDGHEEAVESHSRAFRTSTRVRGVELLGLAIADGTEGLVPNGLGEGNVLHNREGIGFIVLWDEDKVHMLDRSR